ncbi:MAB_1171c family putative transporter [Streptomyces sp. NPDC014983]|uniref:MAB_1171c family putative transporter n=1 Tax=Streptomyces sp. NPDC014983 TaxID=3364933 RepID=UPI0037029A09
MLAFFAYAVAATMTLVALWRLPALIYGDSHRRALWGCYAGFAAALWLKTPAVMNWLNHSPVTDLSVLLKHYVSTGAILAILTFVAASYGKTGQKDIPRHVAISRWIERIAWKAALAQITLLTVLFFTVVDRSKPSTDFVPDHAGQWGATTYETVFYIYLGAASAVTCYQWSSAARRAETRLLRTGLTLMSLAMAIGILYVLIRTTFMWVAIVDPISPAFDHELGKYTEAQQILLFFLFAVGASIPTTGAAAQRWKLWRTLWKLYPLWRDLMTAVPGILPAAETPHGAASAFSKPASRLREVIRLAPPLIVRVDRWTQDIADAVEQLRHYAPPLLLDEAMEAAADHEDPDAATEAYWISAVLVAAAANERHQEPAEALPAKPIADTDGEAAWLLRVQTIRTELNLTPHDGRALLDAAKELVP